MYGQDNDSRSTHKLDVIGAFGFSYGVQSLSIPPFQNKVSVGLNYTRNKTSFYVLPGITAGISPVGTVNFESGFRYNFLTLDYSYSSSKNDTKPAPYITRNLNLGLQFKLNPYRGDNLWIWAKGGKDLYNSGYSEEDPMPLKGYNFELKVIYELYKLR